MRLYKAGAEVSGPLAKWDHVTGRDDRGRPVLRGMVARADTTKDGRPLVAVLVSGPALVFLTRVAAGWVGL